MLSFGQLLSQDDADRVGIASHELIENILKYSNGGTSTFELTVFRVESEGRVRIRTSNTVTPERLRDAQALIARIGHAPNPTIVYDELVATSPSRQGSGLGLARIRVEADMSLESSAVGLALTIVAEGRVGLVRNSC